MKKVLFMSVRGSWRSWASLTHLDCQTAEGQPQSVSLLTIYENKLYTFNEPFPVCD